MVLGHTLKFSMLFLTLVFLLQVAPGSAASGADQPRLHHPPEGAPLHPPPQELLRQDQGPHPDQGWCERFNFESF